MHGAEAHGARCLIQGKTRSLKLSRHDSPRPATSTTSDELRSHARSAHTIQPMAHHTIQTPITKLLGIKHPIILAGMNQASGPELAAAVSTAGGCARPASSSATL